MRAIGNKFSHSNVLYAELWRQEDVDMAEVGVADVPLAPLSEHTCILQSPQINPFLPLTERLNLIADVPTRWNSSFEMMGRFLRLKRPLSATMGTRLDLFGDLQLSADEWTRIEWAWRLLFLPADLTVIAQGDKYPSHGAFFIRYVMYSSGHS